MLRYTQEEAVEIVGSARNSGLQPLVGEGFDRIEPICQPEMLHSRDPDAIAFGVLG